MIRTDAVTVVRIIQSMLFNPIASVVCSVSNVTVMSPLPERVLSLYRAYSGGILTVVWITQIVLSLKVVTIASVAAILHGDDRKGCNDCTAAASQIARRPTHGE